MISEERITELAIEACETWNTFSLMRAKDLIRTVAAEVRKEGIEEMRDAALRLVWRPSPLAANLNIEAERLKEQV